MQRTLKRSPSPSGQPRPSLSAAFGRAGRAGWRPLPAALLVLGLAVGSIAPARAATTVDATNSPFTIDATNSPFTDNIIVNSGGELDVVTGGSVTVASGPAVTVNGGALVMTDGSVTGTNSDG